MSANDPDVLWAKKSSFKVDFNAEDAQIKNLKMLDKDLAALILESVEKGTIPAYDHFDDRELKKEEINNIFSKVDSVLVVDPDTYEESLQIVRNDLDVANVNRFRVEQEWYFLKSDSKLQSRLVSISPLLAKYNDDGSFRGDLPLFKVFLDR